MTAIRVNRLYETRLKAPPEQVFPLLCPVREYEWIPQWKCKMIYSESGVAELGCVFSTDFNDGFGPEVWVVSQFEPGQRISFVRIGPVRSTRYIISLKPDGDGCLISWHQEITSLQAEDALIKAPDSDKKFRKIMENLNQMLDYYLQHGTPLATDLAKIRE